MIQNLKQGNKVQIFFESNSTEVYTTYIEAICANQLLVYTPIENGELIELPLEKQYMLKIYNESGIYIFRNIRIQKVIDKNNYQFLLLDNFEHSEQEQRREHYRLDCMVPFLIKDKNDEQHQAIIKDISEGGMLFVSNLEMIVFEEKECSASFNDKKISMLIKILDKRNHTKPGCKYEYRAKLVFVSPEDRHILMSFIFESQRNYIRKNQDMISKLKLNGGN